MFKWIKEIKLKKIVLCAILYTVFATIIHQIETILTIKYYMMPQYFGVWSKTMMPAADPPPASFFVTSFIFTFASGVSLAVVYLLFNLPVELHISWFFSGFIILVFTSFTLVKIIN